MLNSYTSKCEMDQTGVNLRYGGDDYNCCHFDYSFAHISLLSLTYPHIPSNKQTSQGRKLINPQSFSIHLTFFATSLMTMGLRCQKHDRISLPYHIIGCVILLNMEKE